MLSTKVLKAILCIAVFADTSSFTAPQSLAEKLATNGTSMKESRQTLDSNEVKDQSGTLKEDQSGKLKISGVNVKEKLLKAGWNHILEILKSDSAAEIETILKHRERVSEAVKHQPGEFAVDEKGKTNIDGLHKEDNMKVDILDISDKRQKEESKVFEILKNHTTNETEHVKNDVEKDIKGQPENNSKDGQVEALETENSTLSTVITTDEVAVSKGIKSVSLDNVTIAVNGINGIQGMTADLEMRDSRKKVRRDTDEAKNDTDTVKVSSGSIASKIFEDIQRKISKVEEKMNEISEKVKEKAGSVFGNVTQNTKEKVASAVEKVGKVVDGIKDTVGKNLEERMQYAKKNVKEVVEEMKGAVDKAKSGTESDIKNAQQKVGNVAEKMGRAIREMNNSSRNVIDKIMADAKVEVNNAVENMQVTIEEMKDDSEDTSERAAKYAKERVQELADQMKKSMDLVKEAFHDMADESLKDSKEKLTKCEEEMKKIVENFKDSSANVSQQVIKESEAKVEKAAEEVLNAVEMVENHAKKVVGKILMDTQENMNNVLDEMLKAVNGIDDDSGAKTKKVVVEVQGLGKTKSSGDAVSNLGEKLKGVDIEMVLLGEKQSSVPVRNEERVGRAEIEIPLLVGKDTSAAHVGEQAVKDGILKVESVAAEMPSELAKDSSMTNEIEQTLKDVKPTVKETAMTKPSASSQHSSAVDVFDSISNDNQQETEIVEVDKLLSGAKDLSALNEIEPKLEVDKIGMRMPLSDVAKPASNETDLKKMQLSAHNSTGSTGNESTQQIANVVDQKMGEDVKKGMEEIKKGVEKVKNATGDAVGKVAKESKEKIKNATDIVGKVIEEIKKGRRQLKNGSASLAQISFIYPLLLTVGIWGYGAILVYCT